jgi:tetratricopeptide (TPR) repeat protein
MTVLLTRPETEGNVRMQPHFRYDAGVSDADNTLTLSQLMHTMSKVALLKGYYSAAMSLQVESERFLNEVSAEYEVDVDSYLADSQWLKGKILLAVGRSEEALLMASTALGMYADMYSHASGDVLHYKVADATLLSAEAHLTSGNISDASEAILKALSIYRQVFPEMDHDNIAWALYLQGKHTAALGRHLQTESLFRQAAAICKKASTICSVGIADSYQAMGRYSEAEEIYSKVLSKSLKKSHPQGMQTLLCLAKNLRLSGKYSAAQAILESFTSLRPRNRDYTEFIGKFEEFGHIMPINVVDQDNTGDQLPIDATYFLECAELHRALGEFAAANSHYDKCIDIVRALHGARHPLIADAIFWQVENLRETGYGDRVTLKPSKKALHLRKNLFGDQHIDVAYSMQTLGDIDAARGDYVGARVQLRGSLSILEGRLGRHSAAVASVVNSLGRLNTLEGEFTDAHRHLEAALSMRMRIYGEESVYVAESLNNIGEMFRLQRNFVEAKKYCDRALCMFRTLLADDHPKTINSEGNMGLIMSCSSESGEVEIGAEMIDSALARLSVRSTGDPNILSSHPWIRKFKEGQRGSARGDVSSVNRVTSNDEEDIDVSDTSYRSTGAPGNSEKQLTLKVKRLKSDNEYLKTKNDEYCRQLNSLKSQIRLLEIRAHNAEELSQGSKQMLATFKSHDSTPSDERGLDLTPQKQQKTLRMGSLAASLGYARQIVQQSKSTMNESSPRKYQLLTPK